MIKLTDDNKKTWLDALAKMPKTCFVLRSNIGYCCLGVAGKVLLDMTEEELRTNKLDEALAQNSVNRNFKEVLDQPTSSEMLTAYNIPGAITSFKPSLHIKVGDCLTAINDSTTTFDEVINVITTYL